MATPKREDYYDIVAALQEKATRAGRTAQILQAEIDALLIGGGDKTYLHSQGSAATVWGPIPHNLNKLPSVTITTSAGDEVEGDVHHVDLNHTTLTFNAAFAGYASFN